MSYSRTNKFHPKTLEAYDLRIEKIKQSLKEYAKKRKLKIDERNRKKQEEYNNTPKICKCCGKIYYVAWTKSGKSCFCSQKCSRSFSTKLNRNKINEQVSKSLLSKHIVSNLNKIKKYNINPKVCPVCGKELPYSRRKRKTCGGACARKLAGLNNRGNLSGKQGGYRKGSGRSKSGYYDGIFMGSTYELVYYIYQTDHGVCVKRNKDTFEYKWEGKTHKYLPDFIADLKYIEIKGYNTPIVDVKVAAVKRAGKEISVVYFKDLEPMMDYIDKKFKLKHCGKSNNYYLLYQHTNKP